MRLHLSMILLALLVCGCADSDLLIQEDSQVQRAELSLSTQFQEGQGHFQLRANRSGDTQYLPDGSEIGVFLHALTSDQCVSNLRWKAFGSASAQQWVSLDEQGLVSKHYLNNHFSRLYSYYPYTRNPEDLIMEHSDSDVNGYLPALRVSPGYTDYLIGNGSSLVNSVNPGTDVTKSHLLSYLDFRVIKKPGYSGPGVISKLIVRNQISSSWVSLSKGIYISDDTMPVEKSDLIVNTADQDNIYILAIPQVSDPDTDTYFQVTVDGREHHVAIPQNASGYFIWEQAKRHTYRFCLNPDGAITAELAEFEFGGDWESSFTNPKVIVNPGGNADQLSRPTPYWDDYAQSRRFEIAKADLSIAMSWYEGASWNVTHGSISDLKPASTGCQTYRENGGDWRIPTWHEWEFIYRLKGQGKLPQSNFQPLVGTYWSGNWIQNKNHATYWNLDNGTTGDDKPSSKYKMRCVRDIVN